MQQFNIPELVKEIIKDCCELTIEPIDIYFADPIYVVLQIGDDPDYPEDEMEIAFDGKLLKTTTYIWVESGYNSQGHIDELPQSSFNIHKEDNFNEFIELYKSIKVPFWFNTRIESITPDKLKKLETINYDRISIGLESGSEYVRKKLLKRNYTNDYFLKKFKMLSDYDISISVNNIIGFPDETREQIFETIELNRKINAESFGAYLFQPFHGTYLRQYSVEKGYMSDDYISGDVHLETGLTMPHITQEELFGLQKTFSLYAKLPKSEFERIKIAEKNDEQGIKMFKKLNEEYAEKFYN